VVATWPIKPWGSVITVVTAGGRKKTIIGVSPLQRAVAGRQADEDVPGYREYLSAVELSPRTWATSTPGERKTASSMTEERLRWLPADLCLPASSNTLHIKNTSLTDT